MLDKLEGIEPINLELIMEQRYGSRFESNLSIKVENNTHSKHSYSLKNISLGGAFIRAAGVTLNKGDVVSTNIESKPPELIDSFLCKAEIMFLNNEGFGVMWMEQNDECYEPLYKYIQHLNATIHQH